MTTDSTPSSEVLDGVLNALSHRHSRGVCAYFRYYSTDEASVHDIVQFILEQSERDHDETNVTVSLYREILPKLRDADYIDYDAWSETVRYRGSEALELWLNHVVEEGEFPV